MFDQGSVVRHQHTGMLFKVIKTRGSVVSCWDLKHNFWVLDARNLRLFEGHPTTDPSCASVERLLD